MIIISKKRIITLTSILALCIFVCNICINNGAKEKTNETVALPVSNKVIVIDARTSENQMNGAQSSRRNNRSRNKP